MQKSDPETFYPASREDWRNWLIENHDSKQSVWLLCYRKNAGIPTISWSEAVDEALCFGWIDSTRKTIDDRSFIQFFTRRKPKSTWSKVNKEKVEVLIKQKLMTKAGLESIEKAKENGSWTILDEVDALKIPEDLERAFRDHPGSEAYFMGLSKSVKKMMLQWIVLAKLPETRQRRIHEIAETAGQNKRPKQFG